MSKIIVTVYTRQLLDGLKNIADLEVNIDMKVIEFTNVFKDHFNKKQIFNAQKSVLDVNKTFFENNVLNGDKLFSSLDLYE